MTYGYSFDGAYQSASVSCGQLQLPGAIEAALQTTDTARQILLTIVDGKSLYGHTLVNRMLSVTLENDTLGVFFYDDSSGKKITVTSTDRTQVSDGKWHTIAVYLDGFDAQGLGSITFYKDGAACDQQPISMEEGFESSFQGKISVGLNEFYAYDSDHPFNPNLIEAGTFTGMLTEIKTWSSIPGYAPQFGWPSPTDSIGLTTYITYWANCQDGYTQLPFPAMATSEPLFNQLSDALLNYAKPFPPLTAGQQPQCVTSILAQLANEHVIPSAITTVAEFRGNYTSNVAPFSDIRQGILRAQNDGGFNTDDFNLVQTQLSNEVLGVEMLHSYSQPMTDFVRDYLPNAQQALAACQQANFAPETHSASVLEDDAFALAKALAQLAAALAAGAQARLPGGASNPKSTGNAAMSVLAAAYRFILDLQNELSEAPKTQSIVTSEINQLSAQMVSQYNDKIGTITNNISQMCQDWGKIEAMINYPNDIGGFPYVMNSDLGAEIQTSCKESYSAMIVASAYDLWIFNGLDSSNSLPRYFFDSDKLNTWFSYYEQFYSKIWQRTFWRGYAVCNFDNPNNSFVNSPGSSASNFLQGLKIDMPYILKFWNLPVQVYQSQGPGPGLNGHIKRLR